VQDQVSPKQLPEPPEQMIMSRTVQTAKWLIRTVGALGVVAIAFHVSVAGFVSVAGL
jgi:hypothetical protein